MANVDGLNRMLSAWSLSKLGDIADEFVDTARAFVRPHTKTGDLEDGIQLSSIVGGGTKSQARVVSTAKHARWQEEGTGVFGPTGTPIRPTRGNVLVFNGDDGVVFARSVKGAPGIKYWEQTVGDWSGVCARAMNR